MGVSIRLGSILIGPAGLLLALGMMHGALVFAQTQSDRFWLAGRYDGNRVIIYFDAVHFNRTVPPDVREIVDPAVSGFFIPVELPANYIAQFQKGPGAERFKLGDQYDVLAGNGTTVTVKLTTLVGSEGDEEVGNDSFVGALATVSGTYTLFDTKGYYAVRRHQEPAGGPKPDLGSAFATLVDEPVRFDIQTRIVALLTQRMKAMASDLQRRAAEGNSPTFELQRFRTADGSLRYYAIAQWKSGKDYAKSDFSLAAWLAPLPTLHVLAVETRNPGVNLPWILNVVDLGRGRTGIILANSALDSTSTDLVEYRDGVDVGHMRTLQSIGAGE